MRMGSDSRGVTAKGGGLGAGLRSLQGRRLHRIFKKRGGVWLGSVCSVPDTAFGRQTGSRG